MCISKLQLECAFREAVAILALEACPDDYNDEQSNHHDCTLCLAGKRSAMRFGRVSNDETEQAESCWYEWLMRHANKQAKQLEEVAKRESKKTRVCSIGSAQ